jgi:hypothetical protein
MGIRRYFVKIVSDTFFSKSTVIIESPLRDQKERRNQDEEFSYQHNGIGFIEFNGQRPG